MIEDRTERSLRVQPSVNQLGVRGVAAVIIGVQALSLTTELFGRAYEWDTPAVEEHVDFGARLARFYGTPVILAEPLARRDWLSTRLRNFGEGPVGFLLSAKTDSGEGEIWFGKRVRWCSEQELGARIGLIQE